MSFKKVRSHLRENDKHRHKIKREFHPLLNFKYPKLFLLFVMILLSYALFRSPHVSSFVSSLHDLRYLGFFIAGLLFSFGFSTPFAVGFFIVAEPSSILLASTLGALGALTSDFFILKSIKFSFMDEFYSIKKIKIVRQVNTLIKKNLGRKFTNYFLYAFAGLIIASPLPDEVGVTMLAGLTEIDEKIFVLIDFAFNFAGIFIILLLSSI